MKASKLSILKKTLENPFHIDQFINFASVFFNYGEMLEYTQERDISQVYQQAIKSYYRVAKYKDIDNKCMLILAVELKSLEEEKNATKNILRNFISKILTEKKAEGAMVAFFLAGDSNWKLSFIKQDNRFNYGERPLAVPPTISYSYLAGKNEPIYIAQKQLLPIFKKETSPPTLAEIEKAFSVERLTKDFFNHYKEKYIELKELLGSSQDFIDFAKNINVKVEELSTKYAKKLMGQLVFLYFLQKKGWLGVAREEEWGKGNPRFLRDVFERSIIDEKTNYYVEYLRPLFYDGFNRKRQDSYDERLGCKLPCIDGGIFEPIEGDEWQSINIKIPNDFFSNRYRGKKDGTGVLDLFDRYNFTLKEAETYEKEVAIDPEMMGMVFESLLEVGDRKSKGVYYTPREIVQYMCQESLIQYLFKKIKLPIRDLEEFIYFMPTMIGQDQKAWRGKRIFNHLTEIDDAIKKIKIVDPAVGSGAYPLGMLSELVKIRNYITEGMLINKTPEEKAEIAKNRSSYIIKLETINNAIYGVDIDLTAVEITKLRLWLSILVEQDTQLGEDAFKPLRNLNMNIYRGNSLLDSDIGFSNENTSLIEGQQLQMDFLQNPQSFSWNKEFEDIFKSQGGFDIIIGNPPYVGEKGNKDSFRIISNTAFGKKYYQGKMDLFYFFFHKALDIGNETAVVTFITTNYFTTANGAYKLRLDLNKRSNILKMINFNELRIFESALGQHNLITMLQKKVSRDIVEAEIINVKQQGLGDPATIAKILYGKDSNTQYFKIGNEKLYDGTELYIRIDEDKTSLLHSVLNKIAEGTHLEAYCNVNQGIVSGADKFTTRHMERYPIDRGKNTGIFVLTREEITKLNLNVDELKLIKPFYKNSDISRYNTRTATDKGIIYIPSALRNIHQRYPNIEKHLKVFYPILSQRREALLGRIGFFHLQWSRREGIFQAEKIVAPQRSKENTFAYNDIPWYSSADVYYITKKNNGINLKYLLGILNSKLYYVWFYYRGKRKGEILELYQTPLKETPIIINHQMEMKLRTLVDKIIESNDVKQRLVIQNKIDQIVYDIYAINQEEINAIEAFIQSKKTTPSEQSC